MKNLVKESRIFHAPFMLILLMISLFVGINARLLMGHFLADLANVDAIKVLLSGSDAHMRDTIRWYAQSQLWLPDVNRNAPVVLASLYTTDCIHETALSPIGVISSDSVWFALKGLCSWLGGKRDGAIQIWQQGGLAPYLYDLAVWDQALGRVDRSLEEYTALLAVDTSSVEGWLGLGSLYEKLKNWPQAEMAYEEAILLAPDNPLTHQAMAWYRWGRALEGNRTEYEILMAIQLATLPTSQQTIKPITESAQLYTRIRTVSLDLPNLYIRLASIYIWTGKPNLAEDAALKAIALEPRLAWAYYCLGDALQMQSRNAEAIVAYKKSLSLGKTSDWLHFGLSKAYLGIGDLNSALNEAQYLLTVDPSEPQFISLLCEIQPKPNDQCH